MYGCHFSLIAIHFEGLRGAMRGFGKSAEIEAKLAALDKSQAVIEFDLDGKILTANQNFLDTLGYALNEIVGRQHAMFVEPAYAAGAEYKAFWAALKRGEYQSG